MFQTCLAIVVFLFPLAYSPGPGNLIFAANGARFGFRATLPATFGYHLATWITAVALGFGLIAALQDDPRLFLALKLAGALYVLWLAWKLYHATAMTQAASARPIGFTDGAVLLALNPKAYVIMALLFTQFLDAADATPVLSVLLIATVFTLNNLVAFSVWTLAGDRIADRFRAPAAAARLNRGLAAILALVALWMMLA